MLYSLFNLLTLRPPIYRQPSPHSEKYAVHFIMDSDTQPHCPTCRDSLDETHAIALASLTEKVEALGDLVFLLAAHLGAVEDDPESQSSR